MGAFSATFEIANLAGEQFVEITALVDTGSTYTTIPVQYADSSGGGSGRTPPL